MSLLFIFDMDDVLYDYDWRVRMAGMTELTGISLSELRELWWHDDGEWAGEAGVFETPDAYLGAFSAAIGAEVDGCAVRRWPCDRTRSTRFAGRPSSDPSRC